MDWQIQLITLYTLICNEYSTNLWQYCQRFSNYVNLEFLDEEVMTVFLFGIMSHQYKLKEIYNYTARHLKDWFPKLPSYQAFVYRINLLGDAFIKLIYNLMDQIPPKLKQSIFKVMDSMPIIMAQGNRRYKAKVATELATNNGYCSSKKLHYAGVKLHMVADYNKGSLPIPCYIGLTDAGMPDIRAFEHILPILLGSTVFADKAYQTQNKPILARDGMNLYTPVKKQKGQEYEDAADNLLSTAVSRIRQPIESFFNWIEEKTKIQMAGKVRSYNGLIVHVFGRISAAFFMLLDKVCP
jgi:hypothetical protein